MAEGEELDIPSSGRDSIASGVGGTLACHSFSMLRRYLISAWNNCTRMGCRVRVVMVMGDSDGVMGEGGDGVTGWGES